MLVYHFKLGLQSLRRNPLLTALMVLTIGIGVASSMTTYSVFRATSKNPIPDRSSRLFIPQIDSWGESANAENDGESALYPIDVSVMPTDKSRLPLQVSTYATYADTFPMFEIPFLFGSGWSSEDDRAHAAVAVISRSLNQKLFSGENSVGRELVLDHHTYRIVGVRDT